MAKKLTKQALNKILKGMDKTELITIITDIFSENKKVKEQFHLMFLGEEAKAEIIKKYKKQINKLFGVRSGFLLEKA